MSGTGGAVVKPFGTEIHRRLAKPRAGKTFGEHLKVAAEWTWEAFDPGVVDDSPAKVAAEVNYRPGSKRQRVVLSFAQGPILSALRESTLKYASLSLDDVACDGRVEFTSGKKSSATLSLGRVRVDLRDVAAVIWAPPPWTVFADGKPIEHDAELGRNLVFRRWSQIVRDLATFVPADAVWLPGRPLDGSQDWQNRLAELEVARALGFAVPETTCTNDPAHALRFMQKAGGRVLFREWSIQPFLLPTYWVTSAEIEKQRERFKLSPCTLMKYIDKAYDIRAVVVGDRIFAVRIDSQASPSEEARVDWRNYDFKHQKYELITLPKALQKSMLRLMKRLDLRWGSFDFVMGKDKKLYFLEVNRPGACQWLKPLVGLDVAAEVVKYLETIV